MEIRGSTGGKEAPLGILGSPNDNPNDNANVNANDNPNDNANANYKGLTIIYDTLEPAAFVEPSLDTSRLSAKTKRRTRYYDFKSYASMVTLYGKEAFQCSYSSPLYSKKVWKKCREEENWEFPPHDVIARILSQDSSSISQIIQIVAWVLNAASSSQQSRRRMQVGYHQPSQIVQPWQLLSQIPCASMLVKCPFKVKIEEKEWFHYYKPGDYWITGIMSGISARLYQCSFFKPPTHQLKSPGPSGRCRRSLRHCTEGGAGRQKKKV
ncbi:hypothetical protein E2320_023046 [Naja naja]|nr:hypothetical protein E2320_023046 [Naja naja]